MIVLALMRKIKIDKAFHFLIHVLAFQILRIAVASARFPIKRIAYRIKDRCFSCTCISTNQEQTFLLKLGKINLRLLCIRPKRLHYQFSRLHRFPPPSQRPSSYPFPLR